VESRRQVTGATFGDQVSSPAEPAIKAISGYPVSATHRSNNVEPSPFERKNEVRDVPGATSTSFAT
jgi:hypothetical protein